jgi:hypothetical protein
MRLTITPADVKRAKLVPPGWYVSEVSEVKREPNKAGDSVNFVVDFLGKEGAADGAMARVWFTEKAPGFALAFAEAILGQKIDENTGVDFEFDTAKGRKLKCLWDQSEYEGRKSNTIKDYAPIANATMAAGPAVPSDF